MRSIEQLMTEVLALPSASRALLAERLVESLEVDFDSTLQETGVIKEHQTAQKAGFLQMLLASGLTQQIKHPTSGQSIKRRLIEIQGEPLSETILEERR